MGEEDSNLNKVESQTEFVDSVSEQEPQVEEKESEKPEAVTQEEPHKEVPSPIVQSKFLKLTLVF